MAQVSFPRRDCLASHFLVLTSPTQQPQGLCPLLFCSSPPLLWCLLHMSHSLSWVASVFWLFQGKVVQLPEGQTIVSSVLQDRQHVSRCPLCIMCPQDVVLLNRGSCHLLSQCCLLRIMSFSFPITAAEPSVMVGKKAGVC